MSKRKRGWEDDRETKKLKRSPDESTDEKTVCLKDVVLEIVKETPAGKSAKGISEIIARKAQTGDIEHEYSRVRVLHALLDLVRKRKITRNEDNVYKVLPGSVKTNTSGTEDELGKGETTVGRKTMNWKTSSNDFSGRDLKDVLREIVEENPGNSVTEIKEIIAQKARIGEQTVGELDDTYSYSYIQEKLLEQVRDGDLQRRFKEDFQTEYGRSVTYVYYTHISRSTDSNSSSDNDGETRAITRVKKGSLASFCIDTFKKNPGVSTKFVVDALLELEENERNKFTKSARDTMWGSVSGVVANLVGKNVLRRAGRGGRYDPFSYFVISSSDSSSDDDDEEGNGDDDDEGTQEENEEIAVPIEIEETKSDRFKEDAFAEFSKINEIIETREDDPEVREYRELYLDGLRKLGENVLERITGNNVFELV